MPHAAEYLRPYADAAKLHGGRFEATLWRSEAMQQRRFEVLAEISALAARSKLRPVRILDAGCGRGDFARYLAGMGIEIGEGIGIEAMPALRRAAARGAPSRWRFLAGDFLADPESFRRHAPDLVFFSGSLNTFTLPGLRRAVGRAFEAASIGVAFNVLSKSGVRRAEPTSPARRFDTPRLLEWAMGLTPVVALRQDYLGSHDATLWLCKDSIGLGTG
jgi:SAM-dependent methyltransferase